MATNTYVALATQTLTTATTTVTFTSIPQTYTDLVLVTNGIESAYLDNIALQFNNDNAGTNYSYTQLVGNGSAVSSARQASASALPVGLIGTEQGMTVAHIMNYSNATSYKSIIGRGSVTNSSVRLYSGIWRGTAAITTLTIATGSNMSVGSTFTLYGVKAWAAETGSKATGGEVFYDSNYCYHVFKYSGNFVPSTSLTADFMMVGGGGGAGTAGGGAGGFRLLTSQSFTATTYPVVIGAGGAGTGYNSGGTSAASNGTSTTFYSTTATYGGGGGNQTNSTDADGQPGGSGGGEGYGRSQGLGASDTAGTGNLGGFSPVEGYAGGLGKSDNATYTYGGGGGGAGGVGATVTGNTGAAAGGVGAGGTGYTNYAIINTMGAATNTGQLSGGHYYYAGGGSSYGPTPVAGGLGGGAQGATGAYGSPVVYSGAPATGGGGGGANSDAKGGRGGSGIVIIRYAR